jgi:L-cystine uptake protein TcyP (sodium:dicarboxylate symporter family)
MSPLLRRALLALVIGIGTGVISAMVWPGDLAGEPMTAGHWIAVGGFLVTAVLLFLAAGLVFVSVIGSAWTVKEFDPNEYLDKMKRDGRSGP